MNEVEELARLLDTAKALTGGLNMVMTATPSFPTSKVTLTSAMDPRTRAPRVS